MLFAEIIELKSPGRRYCKRGNRNGKKEFEETIIKIKFLWSKTDEWTCLEVRSVGILGGMWSIEWRVIIFEGNSFETLLQFSQFLVRHDC